MASLTAFKYHFSPAISSCEFRLIVSIRAWWRHQMETFSTLLALCAGNSPGPVNYSHKSQWRGTLMFSLICAQINAWVNNREAGDLRRHRGHYDVNVMAITMCIMCIFFPEAFSEWVTLYCTISMAAWETEEYSTTTKRWLQTVSAVQHCAELQQITTGTTRVW